MLSSHYVGLVLIVMGLLLFLIEMVVSSSGLSLLFGLASFVVGILLIKGVLVFAVPWDVLVALIVVVALFVFFLIRLVLHLRHRPKVNGLNTLMGQVGEVLCKGNNAWLQVNGELWRIENKEGLNTLDQAKVIHVNGLIVRVKKIIGDK